MNTRWRIAVAAVLLLSVFAWLVAFPAYSRHRAIQAIERVGGVVSRKTSGPQWLRRLGLGIGPVTEVDFYGTQVTDAGLEHLKGLTKLQTLFLSGTQMTDAGLLNLKGLTSLEELYLGGTQVTDAGLEYLKGLTELQTLSLSDCPQVTDAGVKKLQAQLLRCHIMR